MPKTSRRSRLTQPRHRQHPGALEAATMDDEQPQPQPEEVVPPVEDFDEPQLLSCARLLWLPSYEELFEAEIVRNRQLIPADGVESLPPSSYRVRLCGAAAEAYDKKQLRRERDRMAIALHANNMRMWSPSLVARSIAYFNLTTAWQHSVESGQARLASRPTILKALRMMRDCRPRPGRHVFVYGFDQTYEWVGMQKRGRLQAVEHVDAAGMPMQITHEVYINSIQIHLPASLGTLSPADVAAIGANNGSPYTEDYNHLFDFLRVRHARLCGATVCVCARIPFHRCMCAIPLIHVSACRAASGG
jgi:hypothetical protein